MSGRENVDSAKTGPTQNPDLKSYMDVDDREGKLYPLGVLGGGEQVLISTAGPESICTFKTGRELHGDIVLGTADPGKCRHDSGPAVDSQ